MPLLFKPWSKLVINVNKNEHSEANREDLHAVPIKKGFGVYVHFRLLVIVLEKSVFSLTLKKILFLFCLSERPDFVGQKKKRKRKRKVPKRYPNW